MQKAQTAAHRGDVRGALAALLVTLLLAAGWGLVARSSPAGADPGPTGPSAVSPIERVLVVHENISPTALAADATPHDAQYPSLACLAPTSGTAALNTRSGLFTATGQPSDPDTWEPTDLPEGVEVQHLRSDRDLTLSLPPDVQDRTVEAELRNALDPGSGDALLREPLIETVPEVDCPALQEAARSGPRTLIVSVGQSNGQGAQMDGTGLQVLLDTGSGAGALRSPSTRMEGLALLPDVSATVRNAQGLEATERAAGQPLQRAESASPDAAVDVALAAAAFPFSPAIAVVVGVLPGLVGMLVLGIAGLDRAGRVPAWLLRLPRLAVLSVPLLFGVGQWAGFVPWWRAGPWAPLALLAVVGVGTLLLLSGVVAATRVLGGRIRTGLAFGIGAALVLASAAAGSPRHMGALLGPDLVAGGRFYGLSNHLFGLVVGMFLVSLLALLPLVRTARMQAVVALAGGLVVAVVAVAPTMGADFGSTLALLPALGVLVLLVLVRRPRPRHLLWAAGAGVLALAAVLAVSVLDWMRPPDQRSHLGGFIQRVLDGELLEVITGKLQQNLQWTFGQPLLLIALIAALAFSVALLAPGWVRWERMQRWQKDAAVRAVLVAAVVAGWVGWAVNDTGPLLVLPLLAMVLAGMSVLMPTVRRSPSR